MGSRGGFRSTGCNPSRLGTQAQAHTVTEGGRDFSQHKTQTRQQANQLGQIFTPDPKPTTRGRGCWLKPQGKASCWQKAVATPSSKATACTQLAKASLPFQALQLSWDLGQILQLIFMFIR